MKYIIALLTAALFATTASAQLSVETLGAVKFPGVQDSRIQYGVGLQAGYELNRFVTLAGRAITYEGGSVVDEAGLGIEAKLLRSKNAGLVLSGVATINGTFGDAESWGVGIGPKITIALSETFYIFSQGEYRTWKRLRDDALITAGIGLRF